MSPQLRVKSVSIEVTADKAGMVEYPIQHHPHSQAVGLLAESGKVLLTAQHRIDSAVIGCAIAVILCRLKNRTEIEGRHPQTAEIIQLFHYTPQVSAEKVPVSYLTTLVRTVLRLLLPGSVYPPPPYHPGRVWDPGAAETIWEDLIGHSLAKPSRDLLPAIIHCQLIGTQLPALFPIQSLQGKGVPYQSHISLSVQHA